MEFMNRGGRPSQPASSPASSAGSSANGSRNNKKGMASWIGVKLGLLALVAGVTVLALATLWFVVLGSPNSESRHVDEGKMQAVFLNGGQVYFGNIKDLNGSSVRLTNIYYLRVNQQVQPNQAASDASSNDISLVKLGCELHGPTDEMLINRDQVVFWENLKTDGQVAKAVKAYQDQNPKGQDCTATQSQTTTPAADTKK